MGHEDEDYKKEYIKCSGLLADTKKKPEEISVMDMDLECLSSLTKCLRVTVLVLWFRKKKLMNGRKEDNKPLRGMEVIQAASKSGIITSKDLTIAETLWARKL